MLSENIIIVPLYKIDLNPFEIISLQQCFKVFDHHKIIAIKPNKLDISSIIAQFPFNEVQSFEDHFFADIHGYNDLMLSPSFYERFINYHYMLVYQTDAFVFVDKLNAWSKAGYDYIGAPWIKPLKHNNIFNRPIAQLKSWLYTKFNITRNGLPKSKQFYNKVGNGGFSLRNIAKFHAIAISERKLGQYYASLKNLAFNEDLFWSIEVNRKKKQLNIPDYKTALQFSIETFPELAFRINHYQLPFGCHAWEKYLTFWKDKIEAQGYTL